MRGKKSLQRTISARMQKEYERGKGNFAAAEKFFRDISFCPESSFKDRRASLEGSEVLFKSRTYRFFSSAHFFV